MTSAANNSSPRDQVFGPPDAKAVKVLQCLAAADRDVHVSEIAKALGLSVAEVEDAMELLRVHGMVESAD